jgi:hypothetical protein
VRELEELTGVPFWSFLLANVVFGVLLAVLLTWPVCALVLVVYRRSVQRGMLSTAGDAVAPPSPPPVVGPPPRVDVAEVGAEPGAPPALVALAAHRARRAQAAFVVAGLAFGVVAAVAGTRASSGSWGPGRFVAFALLAAWPAVPTVLALGVARRRTRVVVWVACLAAGVLLAAAGGQALDALVLIPLPGLFMLATAARSIRGAAWLVAPALVALWLAGVAALPPLLHLWYGVPFDRLSWALVAAVVALPAAVVLYGAVLTLLYARKWCSDETLLLLQWWFVLALVLAVLFGTQGAENTLWGLAPFAVLAVLLLGVALVARRTPAGPPARLLLLRTFGDRGRSARLLRDLAVRWRWVGSVDLITGTDLATELLEPHEFLDYLRGRLRRHFVRGPADLDRRLAELDLRPDLDGRHRVNELLCHDDTWRPALSALVHGCDAVLIDLRGLTARRTGVVYEIERLVAEVPLDRVVALVDPSTDAAVLRWALDVAASRAPADAPARHDPAPALRTVTLTDRSADLAAVLDALGRAAERTTCVLHVDGAAEQGADSQVDD